MNVLNCKNCDRPLKQTPSKRRKEFCDTTCRSNYWQKERRKNAAQVAKSSSAPKKSKKVAKKTVKKKLHSPKTKPIQLESPKAAASNSDQNLFMGEPVPMDKTGIDLTIWKAEVKERKSKIS